MLGLELHCRRCDGRDLAGLLLGLYRLRYMPSTTWLHRFTATLATKVDIVPPHTFATIVAVLRAMGYACSSKPFAWVMDDKAVAIMRRGTGSKRQVDAQAVG